MSHYQVNTLFEFLTKLEIYIRNGYLKYVLRTIPENKDLERIDQKILTSYQVTFCRTTRARRKDEGKGNVIYIRFDRKFVLLCDSNPHFVFDTLVSHNFTSTPLYFMGYSIGVVGGKPRIMIEPKRFYEMEKNFKSIALQSPETIKNSYLNISPFTFDGINIQKRQLLKKVNAARKKAGLPLIKWNELVG